MQRGAIVGWWDQHQVGLYLVAIVIGGGAGLLAPDAGAALEPAINPVLAALLFATFLGIPLTDLGCGFRDLRFLATVLLANFLLVPLVLPLALALPAELDMAQLAVVTQTLVELVAMVALVRVVPLLVPSRAT